MWLQVLNTAGLILVAVIGYLSRKDIQAVHIMVNSRLSQLLELTKTSAHAAGVLEEKDKQS